MSEVFVYIIATREGDEVRAPIKIGVSSGPRGRLDALQTASPFELVLFREFRFPNRKIALDVEDCFHQTQAAHRLRGEWFDLQPSRAAIIISLHVRWLLQIYSDLDETEIADAIEMVGAA